MTAYDELAGLVTFRPLGPDVRRTYGQRDSQFSASWTSTVNLLADELRHLGASRVVLEIDISEREFRLDGMPRAGARAGSPVVVLSMDVPPPVGHLRYEVAEFYDWQDNVRAIAKGLEALRAVDRYGVTKKGEQYAGWRALPAGGGNDGASVERGRGLIREHGGLREALRATHPDSRDGDVYTDDDFRSVQLAREAGAR